MQKQTGAIILIAATCIGSGMIALPMLLVKLGIIPSVLLMLLIWSIIYYTSLVNIELNLQAGDGLSLGALGATGAATTDAGRDAAIQVVLNGADGNGHADNSIARIIAYIEAAVINHP